MKRSYKKLARPADTSRPVLHVAGLQNSGAPQIKWIVWDGAESDLHLAAGRVVRLRPGDQVLAQATERGLDIHDYRPRVVH